MKVNIQYIVQGALVLSLLLNAYFIGFTLSNRQGPSKSHGGPPPMGNPIDQMQKASTLLPNEYKIAVQDILDAHRHKMDIHHNKNDNPFQIIDEALLADPLDLDALDQAFATVTKQHQKMGDDMSSMLREIAKSLPDAQMREKFFNAAKPNKPPFSEPPPKK